MGHKHWSVLVGEREYKIVTTMVVTADPRSGHDIILIINQAAYMTGDSQ